MIAGLKSDEATELVSWFLPECFADDDEEVVASEMGAGTGSVALLFCSRNFQGDRRQWRHMGPTDTGEKTESADDEGSGDSNSDNSNSD